MLRNAVANYSLNNVFSALRAFGLKSISILMSNRQCQAMVLVTDTDTLKSDMSTATLRAAVS